MVRLSAFADEAGDSLDEQLRALIENGLKWTDVRNINGKNVSAFTDEEAKEYAQAFAANGIKIACIGSPVGKRDVCTFEELKPALDRVLKTAKIFGADRVRIFSFYSHEGKGREIEKCLSEAVKYAERYSIRLYHENELGIYGESPEKCLELIEKTGVSCVYDPANFVLSGYDVVSAANLLTPLSDFYHVKDARASGAIVPAGAGEGRLCELLARDDVLLTVEPHLFEFGGYAALTERTMSSSEFVYKSPREAFDAGVNAVKALLTENGFIRSDDGEWRR